MKYELPPALRGDAEARLAQLASYIFRLVQCLNAGGGDGESAASPDAGVLRREIQSASANTRKYCSQSISRSAAAQSAAAETLAQRVGALECARGALDAAVSFSGVNTEAAGDLSVAGALSVGGTALTGEQLSAIIALIQEEEP